MLCCLHRERDVARRKARRREPDEIIKSAIIKSL